MEFIPTGPLTLTYMIAMMAVAVSSVLWGTQATRVMCLALIVSWVSARLATVSGDERVLILGLTAAGIIAFVAGTRSARSLTFIYAVRTIMLSVVLPNYSWFLFWEINRVLVWLQLLIVVGAQIDAGLRKHDTVVRSSGRSTPDGALSSVQSGSSVSCTEDRVVGKASNSISDG